jgi:hypothetical protein
MGKSKRVTVTLTDTERFFYDHAGFSYNPETETADAGHARCAIAFAAAEKRLQRLVDDGTHSLTWEEDPEYDPAGYDPPEPEGTRGFGAILRRGTEVLGSLWAVTFATNDPSDPYARVVAAELADEYL